MLRKYGAGRKKDEVHQHFEYDYREVERNGKKKRQDITKCKCGCGLNNHVYCNGCAVNKKLKFFLELKT